MTFPVVSFCWSQVKLKLLLEFDLSLAKKIFFAFLYRGLSWEQRRKPASGPNILVNKWQFFSNIPNIFYFQYVCNRGCIIAKLLNLFSKEDLGKGILAEKFKIIYEGKVNVNTSDYQKLESENALKYKLKYIFLLESNLKHRTYVKLILRLVHFDI